MGTNFYKADKGLNWGESVVVSDYINGLRFRKDKYGSIVRTKLTNGATKYNTEFLRTAKDLTKQYTILISIECMFIAIIQDYREHNSGIIGNIWHIMTAQKGTEKFLRSLSSALKSYKIEHQNVYDAIKTDLNKTEERLNRNMMFLDYFAEQTGLKPVVDIIAKKHKMSLYDFTYQFSNNYFDDNKDLYFTDIEKYRENLNNEYIKEIKRIASDNGINIHALIKESSEKKQEERKLVKEKISQENRARRYKKAVAIAENIFSDNSDKIMRALEDGNRRQDVPQKAFDTLMHNLRVHNGVIYVITKLKGHSLVYYADDTKDTCSLGNAYYFCRKEEAEDKLTELKSLDDTHAYEVCKITLPESVTNQESGKYTKKQAVEEAKRKFKENMDSGMDNVRRIHMEKNAIENMGVVYYIIALNKYNEVSYIDEDSKSVLGHAAYPTLYKTKDEANKALKRLKSQHRFNDYNMLVIREKIDKYSMFELCKKITCKKFDKLCNILNLTETDKFSIFSSDTALDHLVRQLISNTEVDILAMTSVYNGLDVNHATFNFLRRPENAEFSVPYEKIKKTPIITSSIICAKTKDEKDIIKTWFKKQQDQLRNNPAYIFRVTLRKDPESGIVSYKIHDDETIQQIRYREYKGNRKQLEHIYWIKTNEFIREHRANSLKNKDLRLVNWGCRHCEHRLILKIPKDAVMPQKLVCPSCKKFMRE